MATTTTTLQAMTPTEIDTEIAELSERRAQQAHRLSGQVDHAHRLVGDTRPSMTGRWGMTWEEVLASADRVAAYNAPTWAETITEIENYRYAVEVLDQEIAKRNEEWAARGYWSRFFLVKNNGGHIHKTMACSTCFVTTIFGWLPQLSGLDEAAAVADQGEILCTICFPSAPVAWTQGESRATTEAKAQRAAEKAERDAKKLAKALLPDGSALVVDTGYRREHITTLHSAKMELTSLYAWNKTDLPAVGIIAEAIANKTGETVAQVLAAAQKRAAKRQ